MTASDLFYTPARMIGGEEANYPPPGGQHLPITATAERTPRPSAGSATGRADGPTVGRMQPAPRVLLTPAEVAELLRVSTRQVRDYVATGALPAFRLSERVIRIDSDDLQTFLRRGRAAS